jgi:hypothetical protein
VMRVESVSIPIEAPFGAGSGAVLHPILRARPLCSQVLRHAKRGA